MVAVTPGATDLVQLSITRQLYSNKTKRNTCSVTERGRTSFGADKTQLKVDWMFTRVFHRSSGDSNV